MFKTKKFALAEIIVPSTITGANQRINFLMQPTLQSISNDKTVWIKAIEVFSVEQLAFSPLTTSSPVATVAAIKNATLTLLIAGTEDLQQIPMAIMCRNINGTSLGVPEPFFLDNVFNVDWSKSYITMVAAPASPPFSYIFGVHYASQADISASEYQR